MRGLENLRMKLEQPMSTTTIANRSIETNEAIDRLTEALKQKPSDPAARVSLQLLTISTQAVGMKCCTK